MKVIINGVGFGGDKIVCNHETAVKVMALLPELRPVTQDYINGVGYRFTLTAKRTQDITFTCVNDDKIILPEDLKELVEVQRESASLDNAALAKRSEPPTVAEMWLKNHMPIDESLMVESEASEVKEK
jgi:hypothetical protein